MAPTQKIHFWIECISRFKESDKNLFSHYSISKIFSLEPSKVISFIFFSLSFSFVHDSVNFKWKSSRHHRSLAHQFYRSREFRFFMNQKWCRRHLHFVREIGNSHSLIYDMTLHLFIDFQYATCSYCSAVHTLNSVASLRLSSVVSEMKDDNDIRIKRTLRTLRSDGDIFSWTLMCLSKYVLTRGLETQERRLFTREHVGMLIILTRYDKNSAQIFRIKFLSSENWMFQTKNVWRRKYQFVVLCRIPCTRWTLKFNRKTKTFRRFAAVHEQNLLPPSWNQLECRTVL